MTISSETMRAELTGNGSNDTFPFTFLILDDDDLEVYVAGVLQTKTTHYTIPAAGVGQDSGGNVVFEADFIPADQASVVLLRQVSILQSTDYVEGDDFPANTHERALDKLTMIAQQLNEMLERCVQLSKWSTYDGLTLPDPEASQYLQWKDDLSGLENVSLQTTALAVSAFVETLLNDGDAATFLGTLGLGVMRRIEIRIVQSGAGIKVESVDQWNGDAVAQSAEILKGGSDSGFALDAVGDTLTMDSSVLTGDAVAVLSVDVIYNDFATNGILVEGVALTNDLLFNFIKDAGGSAQDMTLAANLYFHVTYLTDA
jgi:hypothetical protein